MDFYIFRTEYESECWTKQEEHDVEDDVVTCKTVQVKITFELINNNTIFNLCFGLMIHLECSK